MNEQSSSSATSEERHLLPPTQMEGPSDYGGLGDRRSEHNEDGQSQMGQSVLYRELQNQNQEAVMSSQFKQFRASIFSLSVLLCLLLTATVTFSLLSSGSSYYGAESAVCPFNLFSWFVQFTSIVTLALGTLVGRYYFLKRDRKEHLPLYFLDLLLVNVLLTYIFFAANVIVLSSQNNCSQIEDKSLRMYYYMLCIFATVGYLQFIKCIVLSFMIPICAFLIHKLVISYGLNANGEVVVGDQGLIGGLMRMPLPIPEIINSLRRSKFAHGSGLQNQCSICWLDFQQDEEVTPLMCDERHLYHTTCIEAWIKQGHNSCPLCRKPIANLHEI